MRDLSEVKSSSRRADPGTPCARGQSTRPRGRGPARAQARFSKSISCVGRRRPSSRWRARRGLSFTRSPLYRSARASRAAASAPAWRRREEEFVELVVDGESRRRAGKIPSCSRSELEMSIGFATAGLLRRPVCSRTATSEFLSVRPKCGAHLQCHASPSPARSREAASGTTTCCAPPSSRRAPPPRRRRRRASTRTAPLADAPTHPRLEHAKLARIKSQLEPTGVAVARPSAARRRTSSVLQLVRARSTSTCSSPPTPPTSSRHPERLVGYAPRVARRALAKTRLVRRARRFAHAQLHVRARRAAARPRHARPAAGDARVGAPRL